MSPALLDDDDEAVRAAVRALADRAPLLDRPRPQPGLVPLELTADRPDARARRWVAIAAVLLLVVGSAGSVALANRTPGDRVSTSSPTENDCPGDVALTVPTDRGRPIVLTPPPGWQVEVDRATRRVSLLALMQAVPLAPPGAGIGVKAMSDEEQRTWLAPYRSPEPAPFEFTTPAGRQVSVWTVRIVRGPARDLADVAWVAAARVADDVTVVLNGVPGIERSVLIDVVDSIAVVDCARWKVWTQ